MLEFILFLLFLNIENRNRTFTPVQTEVVKVKRNVIRIPKCNRGVC